MRRAWAAVKEQVEERQRGPLPAGGALAHQETLSAKLRGATYKQPSQLQVGSAASKSWLHAKGPW